MKSGFTCFLFTTTGLCDSYTESHIYLLDPCLHDNSSSRGGCLSSELDVAPRRCSKYSSLSFDDFKQTAFTPSILSHLLFRQDLTLKSSFSTLEILPKKGLQDQSLQLCILYINSSTGIASLLQNFTV